MVEEEQVEEGGKASSGGGVEGNLPSELNDELFGDGTSV